MMLKTLLELIVPILALCQFCLLLLQELKDSVYVHVLIFKVHSSTGGSGMGASKWRCRGTVPTLCCDVPSLASRLVWLVAITLPLTGGVRLMLDLKGFFSFIFENLYLC